MHYWLSKPPVLGLHLGGFNILFEDEDDNSGSNIKSNITASIEFLNELHTISKVYSDKDGLDRSELYYWNTFGWSKIGLLSGDHRTILYISNKVYNVKLTLV